VRLSPRANGSAERPTDDPRLVLYGRRLRGHVLSIAEEMCLCVQLLVVYRGTVDSRPATSRVVRVKVRGVTSGHRKALTTPDLADTTKRHLP